MFKLSDQITYQEFWKMYLVANGRKPRGLWKVNHVQQIQVLLVYLLDNMKRKNNNGVYEIEEFDSLFFRLVNYNNKEWDSDSKEWINVREPVKKEINEWESGLTMWKQENEKRLKSLEPQKDDAIILKCQEELLDLCKIKNIFYNNEIDSQQRTTFIPYPNSDSNDRSANGMNIFKDKEQDLIGLFAHFQNEETQRSPTYDDVIKGIPDIPPELPDYYLPDMPQDGDPKQTETNTTSTNETVDDIELSYKTMLQQYSSQINLLNQKIEELILTDKRLDLRCDAIDAKCDKISTSHATPNTSRPGPSNYAKLNQSVHELFVSLKEMWENEKEIQELKKDDTFTIEDFFQNVWEKKGYDKSAKSQNKSWYKAQGRFYAWIAMNDEKRRFTFDLSKYQVKLQDARTLYKQIDWKTHQPDRFKCFKPPEGFGYDNENNEDDPHLTKRRIREAWKRAVIFDETQMEQGKDGSQVPKAKFYNRDDSGNLRDPLTMFGSNMPPSTYALVFD